MTESNQEWTVRLRNCQAKAWDAVSELRGECNEALLYAVENYMIAADEEIESQHARIKELEAELAQARAAAVQWVTYTGEPETLPGIGATVLFDAGYDGAIVVYYRCHPVEGRTWCDLELGSPDFQVEIGDRWAYLPTSGDEG